MERQRLMYLDLLRDELMQVEALMFDLPPSTPDDVVQAVGTVIRSGGKRLRPALTLLSGHLHDAAPLPMRRVAAAIELLHTATLIHDDLIDGAYVRRGLQTLNSLWPANATVLAGDLVFAHAAYLAASSQQPRLVSRFAETLGVICGGELQQMFRPRQGLFDEENYDRLIYAKTAALFALAMESGSLLSGRSPETIDQARLLGQWIGEAFQIVDDVLDLTGDSEVLGKPVGHDLQQGLITLPLLYFFQQYPNDPRKLALIERKLDAQAIDALVHDVEHSGATEWALEGARARADRALQLLERYPPGPHRDAVAEIAIFAVRRSH